MAIIGVGVDVLNVARITSVARRRTYERLANRILSTTELGEWQAIPASDQARRTQFLAVRWSIKESAYKALYPTRSTWKDFTYTSLNTTFGHKPALVYHPVATQVSPKHNVHASVSHDGGFVFTTVIVESG